jgi:RHH-type rel operon transcriptional repressor/antitoxin RelB
MIMEKEKADQMLGIRIPKSIGERLASLAQRTGRSKTYYIREAIIEHLDDLEDVYLAEQVRERLRRGEESVSSMEDVEKRLGQDR